MKTIKNLSLFLVLFAVIFLLGNVITSADSISSDTLDASGGKSAGGSYILESSLGQFDSGSLTGGSYVLNSGYEQNFITGTYINIAVTPTGDIAMSSVSGFMSGQIGDGSADVKVTTDYDGYALAIKSSTNPAFKCDTMSGCDTSDSFANYSPTGGAGYPDYAWGISNTDSEFGYTAKGLDILSKFKFDDTGETCGSGSYDVSGNYCWDALTTSDANIASASASNSPSGTTTKVKFRSQVGSSKLQPSGTYKASITVTATANS